MGFAPISWYEGSHPSEVVYYVAVFGELAIADTVEYRNTLYWYEGPVEGWRVVFRKAKRDAVALGARRIVHRGDWKSRVVSLVKDRANHRAGASR